MNDLGIADVISVPRIHGGYPAEKPPEVSEVLVTKLAAGELVPTRSWVGQRRVAAARHGRRFAGNDLNPMRFGSRRSGCASLHGRTPATAAAGRGRDLFELMGTRR